MLQAHHQQPIDSPEIANHLTCYRHGETDVNDPERKSLQFD